MTHRTANNQGFTLVELLAAISLGAILVLGLSELVGVAFRTYDRASEVNEMTRQARFAMQRMVRAVSHTRHLQLPLNDVSSSNWAENIREETVPPTPPTDDSTKYTAVLAMNLPLFSDLDQDGFPDADDDRDGQVDEDMDEDCSDDGESGIYLIDDDGDGRIDEDNKKSDDESNSNNDDPANGVDDDGDNNVDEDPPSDMNADGCPGVCGVDDDGNGIVDDVALDEEDDDEDGNLNEDRSNPMLYFLDGSSLKERTPVPWDADSDGSVTGLDFITSDLAEHVTRFRVERIPLGSDRRQRVDLTLELTSPVSGESVRLQTQVRIGGAL
jgi:prepilin-type N-terminal cleavage/methylation domain-containing protein